MEKPWRPFRFYLSTLLTFVLVIGLFMWANMGTCGQKATKVSYSVLHGFPFPAIARHYEYGPRGVPTRYVGWSLYLGGAAADLCVAAVMLGWIYWLGEIRRERHTRRKPYRRAAGAAKGSKAAPAAKAY
jgi:hypothetical protein